MRLISGTTPLKSLLGGGNEAVGFQLTMAIFAVLSIILFWITFATTRERVAPNHVESDIKADFNALLSNGPWLALFIAAILRVK